MSPAGEGPDQRDGEISRQERDDIKRRSADIGRRLEEARTAAPDQGSSRGSGKSASNEVMGRALRLSTELIGGIVVGAAIGWYLDTYLMPTEFGVKNWPLKYNIFCLLSSAEGKLKLERTKKKKKKNPTETENGQTIHDNKKKKK